MNSNKNDLRNFLAVLWKRRFVVMVVFAAVVLTTLAGTLSSTPQYEGKVQIIIERAESDNLTGNNRYQLRDPEFEKTQIQLIRSHAVARRVVNLIGLGDEIDTMLRAPERPWYTALMTTVKSWLPDRAEKTEPAPAGDGLSGTGRWTPGDLRAQALAKNLSVAPLEGSHITEIRYASPWPEFAALAANTYVKAYLAETLDMKMDATRRNLEWMTSKADEERLKLQVTEKRLQEYVEANNLVTLENRIAILPENLAQLGNDLIRVKARAEETGMLYQRVRAVAGDLDAAESVLSVSEGTTLDVLRAQILKAEQHIMELSGKYGSKHPVMLKAVGDLNILKNKRRQEINRIIEKVRNQYELALSNERNVRASLAVAKAEAIDLNEKYVEYSVLKREIETNRQLYDALLAKIKNQSITGETRPVNIWIVEEAKVPSQPFKPNLPMNMAMGMLFGLFCSIGCAYLFDQIDNRIKSTEGVGEALGVPLLGSVLLNQKKEDMAQISLTAPRSEFAESYNALWTTLQLASADAYPRRLLISSSVSEEGKTTTAANLALSIAKAGTRVVLIDADLRKPQVHKVFKLKNRVGLSSYLAGVESNTIMQKGLHTNLAVITAGPIPPNPYELLNSNRVELLLKDLGKVFDVIIFDTPPTLSVADSRLLSKWVDGVILVARAGLTSYPMARTSLNLFKDGNARCFGVFLNGVKASDRDGYYRYYSSYYTNEPDGSEGSKAKASLPPAMKTPNPDGATAGQS